MVDALNHVFKVALDKDKRYVFFGEDIEDPKGGVFKLTDGLSTAHPDRVFNSPLAEATIIGVACGLACYGMRPVFELQFIDFVGPGWSQLVNNLAGARSGSGPARRSSTLHMERICPADRFGTVKPTNQRSRTFLASASSCPLRRRTPRR